jgi:hypothetical protein
MAFLLSTDGWSWKTNILRDRERHHCLVAAMPRCDVVVADIPWDMPDAAVNAFLQLAQTISEG